MNWKEWWALEVERQSSGGDGIRASSAILSNTRNLPEKERFFWRIRCAALKKGIFFRRSYGIAKAML